MHASRTWIGLGAALLILGQPVAPPEVMAGDLVGSVTVTVRSKSAPPRRYYRGRRRASNAQPATAATMVVWVQAEAAEGRPTSRAAPLAPVVPLQPSPAMRQKNEAFNPRVLPVTVGTTVEFPNDDDFYHNVFSVMNGDRFDLGRYAAGKSAAQTFTTPGEVVVHCEIHTRMKAHILVLDTPYFAALDANGQFAISAIPAGRYTVTAWHPTVGRQSRSVEIPDRGEVTVNFTF